MTLPFIRNVLLVLDAVYEASIWITQSDFGVFPQHLQPTFSCWLPVPAFSCLMAPASCCFVTVQMSEWCNKKEAGMKRGITAEDYSHMLPQVAITPRLTTQLPIGQACAHLGKSSPLTESIVVWSIETHCENLWNLWKSVRKNPWRSHL